MVHRSTARSGRAVAVFATVMSGAAAVGAAGLAFGFNSLPATIGRRLPLNSPVLGGLALAIVVAVPFAGLATMAWRGDRRWPPASQACGAILVAWIAIEMAFVRELSFLHPMCAAAGIAFVLAGQRARPPVDDATPT